MRGELWGRRGVAKGEKPGFEGAGPRGGPTLAEGRGQEEGHGEGGGARRVELLGKGGGAWRMEPKTFRGLLGEEDAAGGHFFPLLFSTLTSIFPVPFCLRPPHPPRHPPSPSIILSLVSSWDLSLS